MQHRGPEERERDPDRELDELTSELRVVLPGVTVLFAFLLTLPFAARFHELGSQQRAAYFVAFIASALSLVLLVGESAYHRLRGKPYDKRRLIRTATRQAVGVIAFLLVAMTAVVYLVTSFVYADSLAIVASTATAVAALATWFALPLWRRARNDGHAPPADD